jgi:hypothetical protein
MQESQDQSAAKPVLCLPCLQVFPRLKLDAALDARRLEREEATRQAKANLSKRVKTGFALRVPSSGQLAGSGAADQCVGQQRQSALKPISTLWSGCCPDLLSPGLPHAGQSTSFACAGR